MKKYLVIEVILGLLIILSSCQDESSEFKISANLKGFTENSKVVLSETENQKILDSSFIKNGEFSFMGKLENTPTMLSIVILPQVDGEQAKSTSLFVGNEIIQISGTKDDFPALLDIEGSNYQKLKSNLDRATEPYNKEFDSQLQKMIEIRENGNWNDSLQNVYWGNNGIFENIDLEILNVKKKFIENNMNTHFGLRTLHGMREDLPNKYIVAQFSKVSPEIKKTEYSKALQVYLESQPLKNKDKFYNFSAENQDGDLIEFSNFFDDSRYVLLEFISPHCRWCKMAVPEIKKLAKSKKDSLQVVSFTVDKNKDDWLKTHNANEILWQSLWDKDGRYSETYTKYRISGTPTYFLFDTKGNLVNKWVGFDENTVAKIEQQIK